MPTDLTERLRYNTWMQGHGEMAVSNLIRMRSGVALLAVTLGLTGCSDFKIPTFGRSAAEPAAAATDTASPDSVKLVERDVEDPNIFQVTDSALWDGRPSLGGVWVAYPGQIQPERVIIRNEENKKFVIGALFKRERDNPGPKIQMSSDAATALGILAGKPTVLNVTALKRESVPQITPAKTQTAKAKTAAPAKESTTAGTKPDAGRKKLFTGKSKIAVAEIASAAIKKAATKTPPTGKAATKTASAKATRPAPSRPALSKPFIQIGIFSVETNASNTAISLRTKGVIPIIKAQTSRGKKFWRVLVGPASSKSERSALLKKARGLGFSDAYFVTK